MRDKKHVRMTESGDDASNDHEHASPTSVFSVEPRRSQCESTSATGRGRLDAQDLRSREGRLSLVLDAMPVLIAYCDRDLIYRFCNQRYEEWFGIDRRDIIGRPLAEVVGEEVMDRVIPHVRRVLAGEHVRFEQQLQYRHGPRRHVHVEYVPDRTEEGEVSGYYAMIQDVSDRVRAEHAASRLAAIVECSNDAIVGKDLDGTIISWNAAAERLYGYKAEEIIGTSVSKLVSPDRSGEVPRIMERLRRGESVRHFETTRVCKDGSRRDISLTISPVKDAGGQIIGASAVARDITERKRAEARLRNLKETLERRVEERAGMIRLLHDVASACHRATSVEDAVAFVLRRFSRYGSWRFGHCFRPDEDDPDELRVVMEYYGDEKARFREFREATIGLSYRRGDGLPGRVQATRRAELTGDPRDFLPGRGTILQKAGIATAAAFPVLVGDEVVAVLEFFSDEPVQDDERVIEGMWSIGSQLGLVVERARLERQIADISSDEQQRIGRELHDTIMQQLTGAQLMLESVRLNLGAASSPLATSVAEIGEILKDAQRQVRHLSRGLMPVEVEPEGLMHALEELAQQVSQRFEVKCTYHCEQEVLLRDGAIATHLYRIAQEAVHNAVKHSGARRIDVALSNGEEVRMIIRDDGSGIPPSRGQRLTGSGLRIMRSRADVIGGKLDIQSGRKGTIVECTLPRAARHPSVATPAR